MNIRILLVAFLVLLFMNAGGGAVTNDFVTDTGESIITPPGDIAANSDIPPAANGDIPPVVNSDIPPASNGDIPPAANVQPGTSKVTPPPDGRDYEDEYESGYTVKTDDPPEDIAGIHFSNVGKSFSGTKWRSGKLSSEKSYKDVQKELISIYGEPLLKSYSEKRSQRSVLWMTKDSLFSLSLSFYKYSNMMYLEMQVVKWP